MASHENLTTEEAAEYLRVCHRTLIRWRGQGTGPAYCKAGQRILYRRADLDAWLDAQRTVPVREASLA